MSTSNDDDEGSLKPSLESIMEASLLDDCGGSCFVMTQNTLVLIKPDAVRRRMVGQIITAIENLGLSIMELNQKTLTESTASALYEEHKGKWHFKRNIRHVISGPSIVIYVHGTDAVKKCRDMVETFRQSHKDLIKLPANLVHATSDSKKAQEELDALHD